MRFITLQIGPILVSISLLLASGCELGVVGGEEESLDGGTRQPSGSHGSYLGKFWTTYYYLVEQSKYPGSGYPIYSKSCNVIVSSTYAFYKAAKMEGSAKLGSGQVINYAGSCTCGNQSRTCFKVLGASQPWGQGAFNNALAPLRSIAVDKKRIKLGTTVYIKQWDGVQIPAVDGIGGFKHDGCFRADDVGSAVNGSHYDFFAGTKPMWTALEKIHGTKVYLDLYRGGSKCAYVLCLPPGPYGSNCDNGDNGDNGDCFYGGERGTCQPDSSPCSGSYRSGLCSGPSNVRCCLPPDSDGGNGSCTHAGQTGTCQSTSLPCGGGYKSGLCPGPSSVQCCLPSWGSCTYAGQTGTCQSTSLSCGGGYKSGLCPGAASIKCCLPSWGSCSWGGQTGNCQLTSTSCAGGYKSGLCPGPASVKCCLH